MTILNTTLAAIGPMLPMVDAPQISVTVSPELQTVMRGVAVLLIIVVVVMMLIQNLELFGRGGMGGRKMGAKTIILAVLIAAILIDFELFIAIVNWVMAMVTEIGVWVRDWIVSVTGSGSSAGTVDIN